MGNAQPSIENEYHTINIALLFKMYSQIKCTSQRDKKYFNKLKESKPLGINFTFKQFPYNPTATTLDTHINCNYTIKEICDSFEVAKNKHLPYPFAGSINISATHYQNLHKLYNNFNRFSYCKELFCLSNCVINRGIIQNNREQNRTCKHRMCY